MRLDERLCLQWNNFKENIASAIGDLRQDQEFTDVTLACEDGQQVEVHKVVIVASSPFFRNILKRNKHPHPLIFMRGVMSENLLAMVDFFYHGEANVYQENLDSFLVLARELQLKGIQGNQTEEEAEIISLPTYKKSQTILPKYRSATNQFSVNKDVFNDTGLVQEVSEKALLPTVQSTISCTDEESLDQQVKSMMIFSEKNGPKGHGRLRICKACGKEGRMNSIMHHIEAHHIAGISLSCDLCGQILGTRDALRQHQAGHYRKQ